MFYPEKAQEWIEKNKLRFVCLLLALVYLTTPVLGFDNPLEQAVEWVINLWSGKQVDLSPDFLDPLADH